ncbi:MAG: hypothetical protein P1V20_29395 [Verrucomicrobiales bacterium]|nr:hypothetical protein [Verrucomicrobiales bacterium]
MNQAHSEKELKAAVEHLIHSGCNYDINEFEKIYTPDLMIVIVDHADQVAVLNYEQNYEFFRSKREAGDPPLEETAKFIHLDVSGNNGYVVVVRHVTMDEKRQKVVFSLNLKFTGGRWRVFRETAVIVADL